MEKDAFSRNRKLNLIHTIGHVLHMVSSRKQNGSEITSQNYFTELKRADLAAARSSITGARSKLSWRAFEYLLKELNSATTSSLWRGRRVFAVDGTYLSLPATAEILKSFPRANSIKKRTHYPKALFVTATNVLSGVPLTAKIDSGESGSERKLLISMLSDFAKNSVLLLDRGFDGVQNLYEIHKRDLYFIARMRTDRTTSLVIRKFLDSKKYSSIVEFENEEDKIFKVRLIRRGICRNGRPIVVATNLVDQKYSATEVFNLYKKRWNIETMYRRVKGLFQIEKFTAKSLNGVLQEIWANLFVLGLTSDTMNGANTPSAQHIPNYKNASEVVRRHLHFAISIPLTREQAKLIASDMIEQIEKIICKRQIGRKNPRISKQPINRWTLNRPLGKNRRQIRNYKRKVA